MGVGCYTPENNNTSGRNISNKIPLDQYICPECGKVPKLISFYSDNGLIQFKCKDKEHKIMKVEDYMDALNNSKFNYFNDSCSKCKKIQHKEIRNGIFLYCYDCQKKFCPTHKNKWDEQHTELHDKMCLINQLKERCDVHFDEGKYDQYCLDCQENICKNYSDKIHFKHSIKNFSDFDKNLLEESKEIIRKKNRQLNAIMEFNNLILNTYEKHPNNYLHYINLINLAELLKKEDERDPRELENALIEIKNNMKNCEKAIDDFNIKYQTMITNKETRLILRHKNLEDIIFEEIREMSLYHLQELDLSFNKIKNIDYLKYMFLSFLEYLGLNDNKIEDIKAISQINFRELKLLNLQNNNIKNANYLTKAEMPKIEMIRIDGNRAIKNLEEAINKYNKKLVTIPLTFEDFGKKYNLTELLTKNSIRFELNGNDKGDEILRDLYLLLPDDNKINYLILTNCGIKNIRLLSKIAFPKLENINLSFNNIICIDAISELRNKYLKELYLQENYICNITPLLKTKFDRNAKIDIRNNNLIKSHDDSENIVNNLKRRNFTVEVNYRDKEKKIE